LSKSYGNKHQKVTALNQVSLTVNPGEFLAVVGPSGSGKTTLLRLLAGLEHPDEGVITMDGKTINDVQAEQRDLAMVFQDYALFPHLTISENLGLPLKLRQHDLKSINQQVSRIAELLGITSLLNRKPASLSGGEKQRAALGRAMIRKPKIFLFDEPLSQLDTPRRTQLRREIYDLCRQQKVAAIYTTHDQIEAMSMGDRIAVLSNGVLQQINKPSIIYNQPVNFFVAGFFGSPPMNLLPGRVIADENSYQFHLDLGQEDTKNPSVKIPILNQPWVPAYRGKPCVFGIRPEHVRILSGLNEGKVGPVWRAIVERVEFQGPDLLIHLKIGPHRFFARQSSQQPAPTCGEASLSLELKHGHWFAEDSGMQLSS